MAKKNPYDVIVVGAGIGGLTAAACLCHRGMDVLLCEGSNEMGGCASKFDRRGFRFAAGATVGMGFEAGGVLYELYQKLALTLPAWEEPQAIMDVHLPDGAFSYWQSKEKWYEEIGRQFPQERQQVIAFYEEVGQVAQILRGVIQRQPLFPPTSVVAIKELLALVSRETLQLVPYFTCTVADRLKRFELDKAQRFLCFLNGQLIDSVQTTAEQCPAFLGYTAMETFHQGSYLIRGGVATVAADLAGAMLRDGGEIRKQCLIQRIERKGELWQATAATGETFIGKRLVLNTSLHSLHGLLADELKPMVNVDEQKEKNRPAWGAYVLYAGCKDNFLPDKGSSLVHQFIGSYDQPPVEGNQFLLSLSSPEDRLCAPIGKRAATMSTHTEVSQWWERSNYDQKKNSYRQQMVETVTRSFPRFAEAVELIWPATPVTFQRFTHRHQGKVGGYIPSGAWSWLHSYSIRSGVADLWFCGDTVFPGAGIMGTALSGMTVARQII
ncbi:phytoene desaturase family protein [Heliophilum fasciatum]|uniref:C-3',4' desaturase CrtD n=1 Tax=Heliophilum fasciatum TaxID=35700 RepID=A0A4V2SVM6_9FIRM|nr:NAD(P)/FAD-dependent oxidoreductase [Heliophilum fasciatum]MCW2279503.1 C-3',4' desaturase CrtD [Heliophilum fasciatum]TCP58726.1 C-3',4' desaturase CrtD [Heliophilum fasciatum]